MTEEPRLEGVQPNENQKKLPSGETIRKTLLRIFYKIEERRLWDTLRSIQIYIEHEKVQDLFKIIK